MTYTFLQRSGSAFTDNTIKRLQLDPQVIDGTLFRFDFTNPYSNPNADGAIVGGAVFKNLVEGGPDATYVQGAGGFTINAGKKGLNCDGTNIAQTTYVSLGTGEYDMHTAAGDRDHIIHLWTKPALNTQANGAALLNDRYAETSAWWGATPCAPGIWGGGSGGTENQPYGILRNGGGATSTSPQVANGSLVGVTHLISVGYKADTGLLSFYVDGGLIGSAAYGFFATQRLPSRRSHGTVVFAGAPAAGDTVTINGVAVTFVAAGAAGMQVNIGADAETTATALKNFINANSATLSANAVANGTTVLVLHTSKTTLLTLAKVGANLTIGAVVAAKANRLLLYMKGDYYCMAGEDLTSSGRTAAAAALAEYNGYRPRLVAAGLA